MILRNRLPSTCRAVTWAVAGVAAFAVSAQAQDRCSATGLMAGERFAANHCAAAFLEDQRSVTLWFSESPIAPQEAERFRISAYAEPSAGGKERTMLLVAFCPGGGQATTAAAAVTMMDVNMNHAKSAMAGAQWVVSAPREFKVERLAGEVKPGGRIAGRITGGRSSDGRPYAWDLVFDVTLPATEAAAGLSCGR